MPYPKAKRIAREKLLDPSKTFAAVTAKGSISKVPVAKAVNSLTRAKRSESKDYFLR